MEFLPYCNYVHITIWIHHMDLTKCKEKRVDENYSRIPHILMNKFWKRPSRKQPLFSHLLFISLTIYSGVFERNSDEHVSPLLDSCL